MKKSYLALWFVTGRKGPVSGKTKAVRFES
jgi:hypothetical protein